MLFRRSRFTLVLILRLAGKKCGVIMSPLLLLHLGNNLSVVGVAAVGRGLPLDVVIHIFTPLLGRHSKSVFLGLLRCCFQVHILPSSLSGAYAADNRASLCFLYVGVHCCSNCDVIKPNTMAQPSHD